MKALLHYFLGQFTLSNQYIFPSTSIKISHPLSSAEVFVVIVIRWNIKSKAPHGASVGGVKHHAMARNLEKSVRCLIHLQNTNFCRFMKNSPTWAAKHIAAASDVTTKDFILTLPYILTRLLLYKTRGRSCCWFAFDSRSIVLWCWPCMKVTKDLIRFRDKSRKAITIFTPNACQPLEYTTCISVPEILHDYHFSSHWTPYSLLHLFCIPSFSVSIFLIWRTCCVWKL